MSTIRILDDRTIDKIAAGEVVENPASVVKELVENAIDSGATEIIIEIKNGGKSYIRVTDNGCGISNDELNLSITRHATSKIEKIDDLSSLHTLGFRGEALSSISSVSKFEMTSKVKHEETGKTIHVMGGTIVSEKLAGAPNGTTIIIRDLFFNVPARKKFLKTDKGEASLVTDLITKLALADTNISFKFIRDASIILSTPYNSSKINVIGSIFGSDFTKSLESIEYTSEELSVLCYFTNLNYYRDTRKMQLIYVNGRYVQNKLLSGGIEKAYARLLPQKKFPGFILYISINPEKVDVNIHPQKSIIKFENISVVVDLLYSMISKKLRSKFLSKNIGYLPQEKVKETDKQTFSENIIFDFIPETKIEAVQPIEEIHESSEEELKTSDETPSFNIVYEQLEYIGPLFNTYLLFEDALNRNMYIMDQHAAHERINYEKFLYQFNHQNIVIQNLLIPETIHLSMVEYEKAISSITIFNMLGFDISDFGSKTILVNAIPALFTDSNIKHMFYEILDNLDTRQQQDFSMLKIDALIKRACTASIKGGDKMTLKEVEFLLKSLSKCESPYSCPHGRPIWIKFSQYDLEKYFNRIN